MPTSVDSKPLTVTISPLDATLMKNRGWGDQLLLTTNATGIRILSERSESTEGSDPVGKDLSSIPILETRVIATGSSFTHGLYYQALTNCPFFKSFLLILMHVMVGVGTYPPGKIV